ncbi:MAG: indole-3-glycerol phosphate synthase TrpC [Blautia sp.]|jgi:indole-3-glycerol phosphate synthase
MILDEIVGYTRIRIEEEKQKKSPEAVKKEALSMKTVSEEPFLQMLQKETLSFLCEVKKASPSKGLIVSDFPYLDIAREYEMAGADGISVLTEPRFFQGSAHYLQEIRRKVTLPLLRKDFTVDEYQIYEAKTLGADAVLLIAAVLKDEELRRFQELAQRLGLSALVEVHDEWELERALDANAKILGVNNRNLKDFTVDIGNTLRLRPIVPEGIPLVAESGIRSREDVRQLEDAGVNGVLIGETFMRSPDKRNMLRILRGEENDEN